MKNYLKKLGAVVMAATMIFGAGVVAADTVTYPPSDGDKATITVEGVEDNSGVVVKGYKIVEAIYDTGGLVKYQAIDGVSIQNLSKPTAEEITEIAKKIQSKDLTEDLKIKPTDFQNDGGEKFSAKVEAGSYLILVSGGDVDKIYNPMVVSAGYNGNSELVDGKVNANTLYDKKAYAKSSPLYLVKTITDKDTKHDHGNDLAEGDTANFKIATRIPGYSKAYTDVTYTLTDTLGDGFYKLGKINIQVGGEKVDPGNESYEIIYKENDNDFTIEFKPQFVLENAGKNVVVTYSAALNNNATHDFDANENNVVLEYTKDLDKHTKKIEDTTYHYTFEINGELIKVGPNEDGEIIALDGAKFKLTSTDGKTYERTTEATEDDGLLVFKGLDVGTYTLVETEAPKGFTIDKTPHTVVISANYNGALLTDYSIEVSREGETATSTYKYTKEDTNEVVKTPTEIQNTRIQALPSTGGTGTYLFTLIGVGLMAVATGMYFFNKKRTVTKD